MSQETSPRAEARRFDTHLSLSVIALCLVILNLAILFSQSEPIRAGKTDFKFFYVGALVLRSNSGTELYDYDLHARIESQMFPSAPYLSVNNHPPFELLLFLPFTGLSYLHAFYLWLAITAGLAIASGRLLAGKLEQLSAFWKLMPYALVVCLFPFLSVLLNGQDSAVALSLLVACWLSLRRGRDARAGFFLGLGLFKFQIVLPLVVLLACWKPKILRGFGLSAAILVIISAIMVHPAGLITYFQYLTRMAHESSTSVRLNYGMDPRWMPNLRGLAYGIASRGANSLPPSFAFLFVVALACTSALTFVWAIRELRAVRSRSNETTDLVFAFAVIVSLLLSFHLLPHDLTLLAVPFALVLNRMVASGARRGPRQFALAGLVASFYLTPLFLLLIQHLLVYLYGAVVLACAALVSVELSELGLSQASGRATLQAD